MSRLTSVVATTSLSLFFGLSLSLGCTGSEPTDAEDDCFTCEGKADIFGIVPGSCQADAILSFVSGADLGTLDDDVRLDSRAAAGIVDHGEFSTLAELDAVPYVGRVAFERIVAFTGELGLLDCDSGVDPIRCQDLEGLIDECEGLHNESLDDCVAGEATYSELEACCESDDLLFFCSQLEELELNQGEPNTEFLETFVALQEEAEGDCLPFGGAFFYEGEPRTSDYAVAKTLAAALAPGAASSVEISTRLSRTNDLAPFLDSFGFDVPGLHGAIGFDDYSLARVKVSRASGTDDVMVLHYADRDEVWTVTLSCER